MNYLGICVAPDAGSPKLHGVVLEGTIAQPALITAFRIPAGATDPAEQAVELARFLLAKLPGLGVTAAAIRTAGASPVGQRYKAISVRAHAEGAVLYVLREFLGGPVKVGDRKLLARLSGVSSEELSTAVQSLGPVNADAALAAVCAMS